MKILQITNVFPPYRGGMGQVPYYYAEGLHASGHEVVVRTPQYNNHTASPTTPYRVAYMRPFFSWGLAALCPQAARKFHGFDIVHLHYPAYGVAFFVVLKKLFSKKSPKLIVSYHMDTVAKGWLGYIFKVHRFFMLPLLMRAADRIIVSTKEYALHSSLKTYVKKYPERFAYIPFGVSDAYQPRPVSAALRTQYGIDHAKKIILFVGGMRREHYFKGVSVLIDACAKLKRDDSWQLVCVGKGESIDDFTKQAASLSISDRVVFTGFQDDAVMPEWYASAYVTVLPSIDMSESFGIVLIEAMACGSPTIASNLPGVRSVGISGETGFVVRVGDSDDLAEKIQTLLSDNVLRDQMSQHAQELARRRYTWKRVIDQLVELYTA